MQQQLDLWVELSALFSGSPDDEPELALSNLERRGVAACVNHLLTQAQEVTTMLVWAGSRQRLKLTSANRLATLLHQGRVRGGLWLQLPLLPPLELYIDRPTELRLAYTRGIWTPLSLIALFDLIEQLLYLAPQANLLFDERVYTRDELEHFRQVWQSYRRPLR